MLVVPGPGRMELLRRGGLQYAAGCWGRSTDGQRAAGVRLLGTGRGMDRLSRERADGTIICGRVKIGGILWRRWGRL